jgi:hypothetical protein
LAEQAGDDVGRSLLFAHVGGEDDEGAGEYRDRPLERPQRFLSAGNRLGGFCGRLGGSLVGYGGLTQSGVWPATAVAATALSD